MKSFISTALLKIQDFWKEIQNKFTKYLSAERVLSQSLILVFFFFKLIFLTVNGGYNHCSLISEKKNMMDMEMTSGSVPVCRQGLFLHTGNSLVRDHALSRERLLHVGQLNLAHSDLRYCSSFYQLVPSAPPQCHQITAWEAGVILIPNPVSPTW